MALRTLALGRRQPVAVADIRPRQDTTGESYGQLSLVADIGTGSCSDWTFQLLAASGTSDTGVPGIGTHDEGVTSLGEHDTGVTGLGTRDTRFVAG